MNTKQKAVDVLTVMDEGAANTYMALSLRLHAAGDAVAELIVAAEEIEFFGVRSDRLAAAIARCKGE